MKLKTYLMCALIMMTAAFCLAQNASEENIISKIEYRRAGGRSPIKERGVIVIEYPKVCKIRRYQKPFISSHETYDQAGSIDKKQYDALWARLEKNGLWKLTSKDDGTVTDCSTVSVQAEKNKNQLKVSQYCGSDSSQKIESILEDFAKQNKSVLVPEARVQIN